MSEYNFQKELKKRIFGSDEKLDRTELLEDFFKIYVAKMFEYTLGRKAEDRLEEDALVIIKRNLINEFRQTELSEYQKSVEWYEDLFDATVQEILSGAAENHQGEDSAKLANQRLEVNADAYVNEGGLYVPEHMKKA